MPVNQNLLKAVFWDYPKYQDYESIQSALRKARETSDLQTYRWIMCRFLEHGRVKDTSLFFHIDEIRNNLKILKLRDYTFKKWQRLLDVYGKQDEGR